MYCIFKRKRFLTLKCFLIFVSINEVVFIEFLDFFYFYDLFSFSRIFLKINFDKI